MLKDRESTEDSFALRESYGSNTLCMKLITKCEKFKKCTPRFDMTISDIASGFIQPH